MSRFSDYGSGQRLAFAAMCVGFGLCLAGAIAPQWLSAEVNVPELPSVLKVFSGIKLMKVNLGLWIFCMETIMDNEKCYRFYDGAAGLEERNDYGNETNDGGESWLLFVRSAVSFSLLLSLLCGLIACCRCLCCSGGKTICHGIFAFLAGASGLAAVGIMASKGDSLLWMPFINTEYGWAFIVYAIGSGMMVLSSLLLCFSVPKEYPNGMTFVPVTAAQGVAANVANSSVNQYELNGNIHAFEALPNPNGIA